MKCDVIYFPKSRRVNRGWWRAWGAALWRYFCIEGGNQGLTKQACLYLHPSAPMANNDLIQEVDDDFVSSCSPGNNSPFMIDVQDA